MSTASPSGAASQEDRAKNIVFVERFGALCETDVRFEVRLTDAELKQLVELATKGIKADELSASLDHAVHATNVLSDRIRNLELEREEAEKKQSVIGPERVTDEMIRAASVQLCLEGNDHSWFPDGFKYPSSDDPIGTEEFEAMVERVVKVAIAARPRYRATGRERISESDLDTDIRLIRDCGLTIGDDRMLKAGYPVELRDARNEIARLHDLIGNPNFDPDDLKPGDTVITPGVIVSVRDNENDVWVRFHHEMASPLDNDVVLVRCASIHGHKAA